MKSLRLNILQVFILFFCATVLICCEKDSDFDNEMDNYNERLFLDLVEFNNSLKNDIDTNEKGFFGDLWNSVKDVVVVAGADIVGAGSGMSAGAEIAAGVGLATGGTGAAVVVVSSGVIAGAGASFAAANALQDKSAVPTYDVKFTPVSGYEDYNLGMPHNDALEQIFYGNTSEKDFLYGLFPTKKSLIDDILSFNEFDEKNSEIENLSQEYVNRDNDIVWLLSESNNKGYITDDMEEVYTLFFEALTYARTSEDFEDIISFYTGEIVSSNLSDLEKNSLYASMSVAAYSLTYWSR